jgi:uroporphyrin-III C-methyltransferase
MNGSALPHRRPAGKVWLIGAGPGDAELLTLKAVRVLGEADVVLVDDLVNRDILAHARPSARVIGVGKRGGCRSTPQAFIDRLMVPGISSGMAVPASLGIPVTHRECSRGVTFITGHAAATEPNWRALAQSGTTLVIYMGVGNLPKIQAALLAAGLPARLPACAIQNGTLDTARHVVSTLAALHADVTAAAIGSPAIIVIGEWCRWRTRRWRPSASTGRAKQKLWSAAAWPRPDHRALLTIA